MVKKKDEEPKPSMAGKIKDSLYWWLSKSRSFNINDEYELELLHIDREHNSAKILVTNLKNKKENKDG